MYSSVDVHNRLQELGIPHEIFKISKHVANLEQAVQAEGLERNQLALVRFFRVDGKPVMVIVPADMSVDPVKLKAATGGNDVEKIPDDELTGVTGYPVGSIPPVALEREMPAYIDYYTLREDVVYTGSGEPTAILKIRSYDLVRATDGETVDISQGG